MRFFFIIGPGMLQIKEYLQKPHSYDETLLMCANLLVHVIVSKFTHTIVVNLLSFQTRFM